MIAHSNPRLRDILGCATSITGPVDRALTVRAVLAEIGPAWRARLAQTGAAAPGQLQFSIHRLEDLDELDRGETKTLTTPVGYQIAMSLPPQPDRRRLRHLVCHELSHVLLNGVSETVKQSRGMVAEYAAERIGWEISRGAGFKPYRDVEVTRDREMQRSSLRRIVRDIDRLRTPSTDEALRARSRTSLVKGVNTIARAEAYRRGKLDAGIVIDEPSIPAFLASALDAIFAPLDEKPFPALADATRLRAFFVGSTAKQMHSRYISFHHHGLIALVIADSETFRTFAASPTP